MADDKLQVTVDEWAEQVARMILTACKSKDTGVTMIRVGHVVIGLLAELEFAGQELPNYGVGWLELIRDYCDDRLK